MTDELEDVRAHYRVTGLTDRLKAALSSFEPEKKTVHARELATLDQFHTRGMAATVELAALAGLSAGMSHRGFAAFGDFATGISAMLAAAAVSLRRCFGCW
jgi:hypothetical protein